MVQRLHHSLFLVLAMMLAIGTGVIAPSAAAAPAQAPAAATGPFRYFAETGHNIATRVKTFYEANGDVPIFGVPLTEVIREGELSVQYFERAKIELHPEFEPEWYVSLAQVGRMAMEGKADPAFVPVGEGAPDANTTYFPESGHNVRFGFREYWRANGGVRVFGYPLSEEFSEVSPDDGQTYTVQYFERAKFEYHPELSRPIQLARLGLLALERSGQPASVREPALEIALLSSATTGYRGSITERVNNIARAARRMNGQVIAAGATFSFNESLGPAGPEEGYVEGYAIVNGRLEKVYGGGICQVSTTMYRAVFLAGLDIVERRNHSFVINFYENIDGFDATVFAPYTDFMWRNDTGGPVYMYASTNPDAATVTFALYGYNDGRVTKMVGPTRTSVTKEGKPYWQYDKTMARGQVIQLVHGRPGMTVAMQRVVTTANGTAIHNDKLNSNYKPWEDFYVYGPGVAPPAGVNILPPK